MPFSTVFQIYRSSQRTYPCCERGMNPVTMTVINPWKEISAQPVTSYSQVMDTIKSAYNGAWQRITVVVWQKDTVPIDCKAKPVVLPRFSQCLIDHF